MCGNGRYAEGRDSSDGEWLLRGKAICVWFGCRAGMEMCALDGATLDRWTAANQNDGWC